MRLNYYSDNPNDYKVGDRVKDRYSGEPGIVQRVLRLSAFGGPAIYVYLYRKGVVQRYSPHNITLVARPASSTPGTGAQTTAGQNQTTQRNPPPTPSETPAKEEAIKAVKKSTLNIDAELGEVIGDPSEIVVERIYRGEKVELKFNVIILRHKTGGYYVAVIDPFSGKTVYKSRKRLASYEEAERLLKKTAASAKSNQSLGAGKELLSHIIDLEEKDRVGLKLYVQAHGHFPVVPLPFNRVPLEQANAELSDIVASRLSTAFGINREELGTEEAELFSTAVKTISEEIKLYHNPFTDVQKWAGETTRERIFEDSLYIPPFSKLPRWEEFPESNSSIWGWVSYGINRRREEQRAIEKLSNFFKRFRKGTAFALGEEAMNVYIAEAQKLGIPKELLELLDVGRPEDVKRRALEIGRRLESVFKQRRSEIDALEETLEEAQNRLFNLFGFHNAAELDKYLNQGIVFPTTEDTFFDTEEIRENQARYGLGDMTYEEIKQIHDAGKVKEIRSIEDIRATVREYIEFYTTQPNNINQELPSEQQIMDAVGISKRVLDRVLNGKPVNALAKKASRFSPPPGSIYENVSIEAAKEDPSILSGLSILNKDRNIALKIVGFDPTTEMAKVEFSQPTGERNFIPVLERGRIYFNEGSKPALTELQKAKATNLSGLKEEFLENPVFRVGEDTLSLDVVLKALKLDEVRPYGYEEHPFFSAFLDPIKNAAKEIQQEDYEDLIQELRVSAIDALRSKHGRFDAVTIEDLNVQLIRAVKAKLGKRGATSILNQILGKVGASIPASLEHRIEEGLEETAPDMDLALFLDMKREIGRLGINVNGVSSFQELFDLLRASGALPESSISYRNLIDVAKKRGIDTKNIKSIGGLIDALEAKGIPTRSDITSPRMILEENGRSYIEVYDVNTLHEALSYFGEENFETAKVGTTKGVVIHTENGEFIYGGLTNPTNGMPVRAAKNKGARESEGAPPSGGMHTPTYSEPAEVPLVYSRHTGVGYVIGADGYEVGYGPLLASSKFVPEGYFSSDAISRDPNTKLPIWRIVGDNGEESFIGTALPGGIEEQINRAKDILTNNEEFLSLDIETYGLGYSKLGQVGLTKSKITGEKVDSEVLVNSSYEKWLTARRELQLAGKTKHKVGASKVIKGEVFSHLGFSPQDSAEIEMILQVSGEIQKNKNLKILVYNEFVDLEKIAASARRHINRLSASQNISEEAQKLLQLLRTSEKVLLEAQATRVVNLMVVDTAAHRRLSIRSLEAAAVEEKLTVRQTHTAAEDAILTARLLAAKAKRYLGIDTSKMKQVTLGELRENPRLASKSRLKDILGRDIDLGIGGRAIEITGVFTGHHPMTGAPVYGLEVRLAGEDVSQIIFNTSAQHLAAIDLGNTAPIPVEELEEFSSMRAKDLFNRTINRIYRGELNLSTTPRLYFEDIDKRFELAQLNEDQLFLRKREIEENLENLYNPNAVFNKQEAERELEFINTLIKDPRMKEQYIESLPWYERWYKEYDKPFFDEIKRRLENRELSRYEASVIIEERNQALYGKRGIFPLKPTKIKTALNFVSVTPVIKGLDNQYAIRLGKAVSTEEDIRTSILRNFYREYKGTEEGEELLRMILGGSHGFWREGTFSGGAAPYYRETLVRELLRYNIKIGNIPLRSIFHAENISEEGDILENTAAAFRAHYQELADAGELPISTEESGIWYHELPADRGITKSQKKRLKERDKKILEKLNNRRYRARVERKVRQRALDEGDLGARFLTFRAGQLPYGIESGEFSPSSVGQTPYSLMQTPGGHKTLLKILGRHQDELIASEARIGELEAALRVAPRNSEEARRISEELAILRQRPGIITPLQEDAIGRALRWGTKQEMRETVASVQQGNLGRAEEWILPIGENPITLGEYLSSKENMREALYGLSWYNGIPHEVAQAIRAYFGASSNFGSPLDVIGEINAATQAATPKGPSVAKAANVAAQTAQRAGNAATTIVNAVSSITGGGGNGGGSVVSTVVGSIVGGGGIGGGGGGIGGPPGGGLGGRINRMIKDPKIAVLLGIGALALGIAASPVGIRKRRSLQSAEIDDEQTSNHTPKKKTTEVSAEQPIHYRIFARIKGIITGNVDTGVITNSIHAAIESHSRAQVEKSHNIEDRRKNISKEEAHNIMAKLLK